MRKKQRFISLKQQRAYIRQQKRYDDHIQTKRKQYYTGCLKITLEVKMAFHSETGRKHAIAFLFILVAQYKYISVRNHGIPETKTLISPRNVLTRLVSLLFTATNVSPAALRVGLKRNFVRACRWCIQEGNWISHISRTQHAQRTPLLICRDSHGNGYYLELFSHSEITPISFSFSSSHPGRQRRSITI